MTLILLTDQTKLGANYRYFKDLMPRWLFFSTNLSRIKNTGVNAITMETAENNEESSNRLYFSNLSLNMPVHLIEEYGAYLAGTNPKKILTSNSHNAVWILDFEDPISKLLGNCFISTEPKLIGLCTSPRDVHSEAEREKAPGSDSNQAALFVQFRQRQKQQRLRDNSSCRCRRDGGRQILDFN